MIVRAFTSGVFRALLAVAFAIMLVVALSAHQRETRAAEQDVIFKVSAMSWSVSEVMNEGLKLSRALGSYRYGNNDLKAVQKHFDLLWSRHDVVSATLFDGLPDVDAALEELRDFLVYADPILFPGDELNLGRASELNYILSTSLPKLRAAWIAEFSGNKFSRLATVDNTFVEAGNGTERIIQVLLALITLYMVSEVYFAGRGRAREKQLLLAAEAANDEKSRFLANVSHEIRTPLNGILGMTQHLLEGPLNGDQKECLMVAHDSGQVLLATINDVLDLSKIEAGGFDLEAKPFDLLETVDASVKLYRHQAQAKNLTLRLDLSPDLPKTWLGDAHRLRQVLHNLISNAIKFTAEGLIELRVEAISDPQGSTQKLRFSVSDTGIGIAPSALARVFEPFRQADNSTSRVYGGTGLGLSISQKIAEEMNGQMSVESQPGVGTTFSMTIPLEVCEEVAAETTTCNVLPIGPARDPEVLPLRVLGVDDNATNRLILNRLLAPNVQELVIVASGTEAIEVCAESYFDIILMDVQMPVMSGVEAMFAIREMQLQKGQRSHIVAVTANGKKSQIEDYLLQGMNAVVTKPISKAALIKEIQTLPASDRLAG